MRKVDIFIEHLSAAATRRCCEMTSTFTYLWSMVLLFSSLTRTCVRSTGAQDRKSRAAENEEIGQSVVRIGKGLQCSITRSFDTHVARPRKAAHAHAEGRRRLTALQTHTIPLSRQGQKLSSAAKPEGDSLRGGGREGGQGEMVKTVCIGRRCASRQISAVAHGGLCEG